MNRLRDELFPGAPGRSFSLPALGQGAMGAAGRLVTALGCFGLWLSPLQAAPAPPPAPATNAVVRTVADLSAFHSEFDLSAGKDPFFPKSRRFDAVKGVPVLPIVPITLKGISSAKGKRLAIISNRTFEVGEEAELRLNGRTVRVRCLEIRESSALVAIDGMAEPKELKLNQHQ